jgi:hypothetical protein
VGERSAQRVLISLGEPLAAAPLYLVRKRDSWRYVAKQLDEAARGGDILDLEVSLWIVLTLESIESQRLR